MEDSSKSRNLSGNEAKVVLSILAGGLESEEERMRKSGIPRTTYRDAKHRLYAGGILEDRYVPNPDAIGVPCVTFMLSRPSAEETASIEEKLSKTPGSVEVWCGTDIAFAVVFHKSVEAGDAFRRRAEGEEFGKPVSIVHVDTGKNPGPVPVYLDFEGAWVRFCGLAETKTYPRPLPPPYLGEHASGLMPPSIVSLLRRHLARPSHLVGPAAIPRSQRRNLRLGKVEWRVFLGLKHLHVVKYGGVSLRELVFVTGELREPDGVARLLPELIDSCKVRPILLAGDRDTVLMASLGIGLDSVPEPPSGMPPPPSVIKVVSRHLRAIQVVREPLTTLRLPIAHGYDRLA